MKTIWCDEGGGIQIHIPAVGIGLNQNISRNITRQRRPIRCAQNSWWSVYI